MKRIAFNALRAYALAFPFTFLWYQAVKHYHYGALLLMVLIAAWFLFWERFRARGQESPPPAPPGSRAE